MINIEIFLTMGLLSLMVILAIQYKSFAKKIDKKSFMGIISGIFMLSLMQLFKSIFIIDGLAVSYISIAPIYFELFYLSNSILGLIILMKSISVWLPLSQKHLSSNDSRLKQMELFKKTQQLLSVENRIEKLFQKLLREISSTYSLSNSAIYLKSTFSDNYSLTACQSNDADAIHLPPSLNLTGCSNFSDRNLSANLLKELPDHIFFPIRSNQHLLGLIACQSSSITDDEKVNLKLITDILGRYLNKLELDKNIAQAEAIKALTDKLNLKRDSYKSDSAYFSSMYSQLKQIIQLDYLSFITTDNNSFTNHTVTANGYLKLKNQNIDNFRNPVAYSFETSLDVIINDITTETDFCPDSIILKSNLNSMATMPLQNNNRTEAVLLLAASEKNIFKADNLKLLNEVSNYLSSELDTMITNQFTYTNKDSHRIIEQLKIFSSKLSEKTSFAQAAIDLIANKYCFDLIRLSDIDVTGQFLESQVISGSNASLTTTPKNGTMVLSLLPQHQKLIRDGKLFIVGSYTNQIDESEMNQIYGPQFQGMLLFPIKLDGVVKSVITMIDINNSIIQNLALEDITLLHEAVELISLTYNIHNVIENNRHNQSEMNHRFNRLYIKDIHGVKASLSGLLGSVELLKNGKHKANKDNLLNIVDRSARRLNDTLGVSS